MEASGWQGSLARCRRTTNCTDSRTGARPEPATRSWCAPAVALRPSRRQVAPGRSGLEPGPQLQDGLGVDLAHPALGDAEHLADLGQGEALVVVEGEDHLLPVAEPVDGAGQQLLHLLDLEGATGPVGLVGDGLSEGGRLARSPPPDSTSSRATTPTKEIWLKIACSSASEIPQLLGHLGVGRRAQQGGLELGVGLFDRPGLGPHRARHPVDRPQLVDDRALDPGDGVGLELDLRVGSNFSIASISPKMP